MKVTIHDLKNICNYSVSNTDTPNVNISYISMTGDINNSNKSNNRNIKLDVILGNLPDEEL